MKKTLIFLVIVLVAVGGYFGYAYWKNSSKAVFFDFVPETAALVFSSEKSLAYNEISAKPIWSAFQKLSSVQRFEELLAQLDSASSEVSLSDVFDIGQIKLAIAPTSSSDLDALVIVPLSNNKQRDYLEKIIAFFQAEGMTLRERRYNGFTISELGQGGDVHFSMLQHKGFLVGSVTPFLVEDAVRAFNVPDNRFINTHRKSVNLSPLTNDEGNLYLNLDQVSALLNGFTDKRSELFTGEGFMDIRLDDKLVHLSGFTYPTNGILTSINTSAKSFDLLDIVPNSVAWLKHYSVQDMKDWRQGLLDGDPIIKESVEKLKSSFDLDMNFFFELIEGEIAVAELEMYGGTISNRLVFFNSSDITQSVRFLDQMARRSAKDSVFHEQVGEYAISKIYSRELSRSLLGGHSELGEELYFSRVNDQVILSSTIGDLKGTLGQIEADETWRKSLRMNELLETAGREANLVVLVNVPRYWNSFIQSLKPEWREVFYQNESGFKSLEFVSLQLNLVEDKFYTTLTALQPNVPKKAVRSKVGQEQTIPHPIISRPFVHKSHVDQSFEVLLQDSIFQLHHLDARFGLLWTRQLSGQLSSEIYGVDYYANGKKQYAFVEGDSLYIIDRNGFNVTGFPKSIDIAGEVNGLSMVDYDGSKNYRFILFNDSEIYLKGKNAEALDGWSPNSLESPQLATPRHIRAAGRDAFVIVQQRQIDLKTRRGTSYPGFPLKFPVNVSSNYFLRASGSFESSHLVFVSEDGQVYQVSLDGKISQTEQLYRPDTNTKFDLIPDVLDHTFLISQVSNSGLTLFDESGQTLFRKPYIKTDANIRFYRFGGDRAVILFHDSDGLVTLYNMEGEPITQSSIRSEGTPSLLNFENAGSYVIYVTENNAVRKITVQ